MSETVERETIRDEWVHHFLAAEFDTDPNGSAEETVRRCLAAVAPAIRAAEQERVARKIERKMNTQSAKRCACPPEDQRSCGWRDGMGTAADIARAESEQD